MFIVKAGGDIVSWWGSKLCEVCLGDLAVQSSLLCKRFLNRHTLHQCERAQCSQDMMHVELDIGSAVLRECRAGAEATLICLAGACPATQPNLQAEQIRIMHATSRHTSQYEVAMQDRLRLQICWSPG